MEHKTEQSTDNLNYDDLVTEIQAVIKNRFPLGAYNRVDTAESLGLTHSEIAAYFQMHTAWTKLRFDPHTDSPILMADITQSLHLGNCTMQVSYAFGYLKNKYPDIVIHRMYFKDHVVLLLGMDKISNPWICDVWAEKSYLLSQLDDEKNKEDIPAYAIHNGVVYTGQDHYLMGDPFVNDTVNDEELKERANLCAWVEEDERRRQLPDVPRLSSPSPALEFFDKETIRFFLIQLSKTTEGWKFSQSTNSFWITCRDEQHAKRLFLALKATKALCVQSKKNPTTQNFVIVCDNFMVPLMKAQTKFLPDLVTFSEVLPELPGLSSFTAK